MVQAELPFLLLTWFSEEEKWRSLLHSMASLLRYVRLFCRCWFSSSSSSFLSWSLEVSLKIVQNLHGHDVTIQTTQQKRFVWYIFLLYDLTEKKNNKIWLFFLTFFQFIVVFFSLKVRVVMRFTAKTRGCLKCEVSPRLTWMGERMYGRFCQIQNFLDGAPLCAAPKSFA